MDATMAQALVTAFGGLVAIASALVAYFTKPKTEKVKIEGPDIDAAAGIFLRIAIALERNAAAAELANQLTMNHFGVEVAAELKALRAAREEMIKPRRRTRKPIKKTPPLPSD